MNKFHYFPTKQKTNSMQCKFNGLAIISQYCVNDKSIRKKPTEKNNTKASIVI